VQGVTLFVAASIVFINFAVDLATPRSIRASAMSSRRHLTFALGVVISLALAATAA